MKSYLERKEKEMSKELEELTTTQVQLESGKQRIGEGLRELETEKKACERYLNDLMTKNEQLQEWLREHDTGDAAIDPDSVVVARDPLSKQLLENLATDQAVEDTIFTLSKAYQRKTLDTDTYLKEVRDLAEKQFFAKAYVGAIVKRKQDIHSRR